jgi:hypothetical protein
MAALARRAESRTTRCSLASAARDTGVGESDWGASESLSPSSSRCQVTPASTPDERERGGANADEGVLRDEQSLGGARSKSRKNSRAHVASSSETP